MSQALANGFSVRLLGEHRAPATPAWVSAADRAYLERIGLGKLVIRGEWKSLLLSLCRTDFRFKKMEDSSGVVRALVKAPNFPRIAATTLADLIMGTAPLFGFQEPAPEGAMRGPIAERWDLIARRSALPQTLWRCAYSKQFEGGVAWLQVLRDRDGEVKVCRRKAEECFVVGAVGVDGQPRVAERRRVISVGGAGTRKRDYVLFERHSAGMIERIAHEIVGGGTRLASERTPLESLLVEAPPEMEETGVDAPLLVLVSGAMVGDESGEIKPARRHDGAMTWLSGGLADDDTLSLIDHVVAAYSQLVRVLAQFTDPKMAGPEPEGDANPDDDSESSARFDLDHDYFVDPESKLRAIVWNPQLDAASKHYRHAVEALFQQLELNPRLVGLFTEQGAPDAYRKLLLESMRTQAKIERESMWWATALEMVADRAVTLDSAGSLRTPAPSTVTMRGGIPEPEPDKVDRLAGEVAARLTDERSAREELHGQDKAERITERFGEDDAARLERDRASVFGAMPPSSDANQSQSEPDPTLAGAPGAFEGAAA